MAEPKKQLVGMCTLYDTPVPGGTKTFTFALKYGDNLRECHENVYTVLKNSQYFAKLALLYQILLFGTHSKLIQW